MDRTEILKMANRGLSLNGFTYDKAGSKVEFDKANREFLTALASAPDLTNLNARETDSPELKTLKAELHDTWKKAMDGDPKALHTLCSIRLEQVHNVLMASSSFASFFEVQTLLDGERAYLQNTSQEFDMVITGISQEATPNQFKVERDSLETELPLAFINSPKVWYRIWDIYNGANISAAAQATFNLANLFKRDTDRRCYNLLNLSVNNGGCYGAFTLTGDKKSRVYFPAKYIDTSHLPTTNDIIVYKRNSDGDFIDANGLYSATGVVKTGRFGIPCLQETLAYCDAWGDVYGTPLRPTGEIVVPASDIKSVMFQLAPGIPGQIETEIQLAATRGGYFTISYGGINWKFTPDLTIPSGTCYPRLNKVPGTLYVKPTGDREFVKTDQEANVETRWQKKVFSPYIIQQRRPFALRLTYK